MKKKNCKANPWGVILREGETVHTLEGGRASSGSIPSSASTTQRFLDILPLILGSSGGAVVLYTFNPSPWEVEAGGPLSSRTAWNVLSRVLSGSSVVRRSISHLCLMTQIQLEKPGSEDRNTLANHQKSLCHKPPYVSLIYKLLCKLKTMATMTSAVILRVWTGGCKRK